MEEKFYMRVIGHEDWYCINGLKALKDKDSGKEYYELDMYSKVGPMSLIIRTYKPETIEFKNDASRVISFVEVIDYFKDRGIGLLIS